MGIGNERWPIWSLSTKVLFFSLPFVVTLIFDCKSTSSANSPLVHTDTYNAKTTRPPARKKSRVGARLIEAAVLAHGNPCESLKRRKDTDNMTSSRQPLKFVPAGEGSSLQLLSKTRSVTLVDPRKLVSFQHPSFSAHSPREINTENTFDAPPQVSNMKTPRHKPITRWKTSCFEYQDVNNAPQKKLVTKAASRQSIQISTRTPLQFIPLENAEKSYPSKSRKPSK